MRKLLRSFLLNPILWTVARVSSTPNRDRVFHSLTKLKKRIESSTREKGLIIPLDVSRGRFILFSDQHKGIKNGADDFALAEVNYLEALAYYDRQGFHFISLGDSEELWENTLIQVKRNNKASFAAERKFAIRNAFTKIFGNHDLDWEINPLATKELKEIYHTPVHVQEGVQLQAYIRGKLITVFCTHGHQGDAQSDGNFFSKFFVSTIWAPLQAYLQINPNTPAHNSMLKTAHNNMMYEWSSAQKDLLLITGHTHQPVFESLTRLERRQQALARAGNDTVVHPVKPSYFNTGCCCFDDGDITGIEIADGVINLIKWGLTGDVSTRVVLESTTLELVVSQLV